MRIYALYGQSRKVLALYIIVAALISVVACVRLNFSISAWHHIPLLILLYIVDSTDWEKRRHSDHSNTQRLRYRVESRNVSTFL